MLSLLTDGASKHFVRQMSVIIEVVLTLAMKTVDLSDIIEYHTEHSYVMYSSLLYSMLLTCELVFFLWQEVETEQFYSYFQPELKKNGYAGVFSAKSRARTMTEQERKHVDGCAIFYKTSK